MATEKTKPEAKTESTAIVKQPSRARLGIVPTNIQDAYTIAVQLAKSGLVPERFRERPQDALAAIMWGAELGVPPMSAMKGIAVINSTPCLFGDLFLSVIMSHPDFEDYREVESGKGTEEWTWTCTFKRKGREAVTRSYSKQDAITAKLWNKKSRDGTKDTPWVTNPGRMLQFRARGFAGRDAFADALAGMVIREEAMDYETIEHPEDGRVEIQMPKRVEVETRSDVPPGDTVAGEPSPAPATEPPLTPKSYTEPSEEEIKLREEYVKIWDDITFLDERWKPDPNFSLMTVEEKVEQIKNAKALLSKIEALRKTQQIDPKTATIEEMVTKKPAESKTRTREPEQENILDMTEALHEAQKATANRPVDPGPSVIEEPPKKLKKDMTTAEKLLGSVDKRSKPERVLMGTEYDKVSGMHVKKLHVVLSAAGIHSEQELYAKLWKSWGIESSADIPRSEYQKVLAWAGGDKYKIK